MAPSILALVVVVGQLEAVVQELVVRVLEALAGSVAHFVAKVVCDRRRLEDVQELGNLRAHFLAEKLRPDAVVAVGQLVFGEL